MLLAELREQVIEVAMEAFRRGVVYGTAGNFSVRDPETEARRICFCCDRRSHAHSLPIGARESLVREFRS